ncbi:MAG TPA: VOC family protein [Alphaproteobacteria bacterium]|jgi:catechol 2,3-dioxygenase-like lactoylglutathione lyase family enzyme
MKARINHLTILSEDHYALGRFYEGFFHMRPAATQQPLGDVRIGDGHVGLNINPRLSGYRAQLERFGIEVDDIAQAMGRIRERYPAIEWLEPPSGESPASQKGASISIHDPDGNVFILSQAGRKDRDDIYEPSDQKQARAIDHVALRVLHPRQVAEFYETVFELKRLDRPSDNGTVFLSDGNVTLVVIPWRLSDFLGTGISARGMDHIGFRVESVAALKADIEQATARNPGFQPSSSVVGRGKEGGGRLTMFRKSCPLGCHHFADPDGLLLDVTE